MEFQYESDWLITFLPMKTHVRVVKGKTFFRLLITESYGRICGHEVPYYLLLCICLLISIMVDDIDSCNGNVPPSHKQRAVINTVLSKGGVEF